MTASATSYARPFQKHLRSCAYRESAVLLFSSRAQVFQADWGIYDCLRRTGGVTYLGQAGNDTVPNCWQETEERCGRISDEALSGAVVAYTEARREPSGGRQPK